MWTSIISLLGFGGESRWVKYAAIGVAVLAIAGPAYYYVSGYYKAWNMVAQLETANTLLQSEIETQKTLRELESEARKRADAALLNLQSRIDLIRNDREVIYRAPKEDDGTVAPVLRDYLDRLRRSREPFDTNRNSPAGNPESNP